MEKKLENIIDNDNNSSNNSTSRLGHVIMEGAFKFNYTEILVSVTTVPKNSHKQLKYDMHPYIHSQRFVMKPPINKRTPLYRTNQQVNELS